MSYFVKLACIFFGIPFEPVFEQVSSQFHSFLILLVRLESASFGNTEEWDLDRVLTQKGLYVLVDFN